MRQIISKVLLLAITFCMITVKLFAQSSTEGKITGKILGAQTNETIPVATAMLLDRKTKKTVEIVQSDVKVLLHDNK